jgi:hypothetical protein
MVAGLNAHCVPSRNPGVGLNDDDAHFLLRAEHSRCGEGYRMQQGAEKDKEY